MLKTHYLFAFILSTIIQVESFAQKDVALEYSKTITSGDLKAHLSIVASDSFEGRNTGEKGQKLAAAYIANQFKMLGLSAVVKQKDTLSYYQTFNVFRQSWNDSYFTIGESKKIFMKDFFSIANPDFREEEDLAIVFGGFGINNFSEVKGKGVVMFASKEQEENRTVNTQKTNSLILTSNYNKKYKQLLDSGARAIFLIPGISDTLFYNFLNKYKCELEEADVFAQPKKSLFSNLFFIPPSVGAEMFGLSSQEFTNLSANFNDNISLGNNNHFKNKSIRIKSSKKIQILSTENILGFVEGTDKKDEILIITAHYDHEGIKCGEIYNGADDDGTGTVSILEIAQAFALAKKEGNGPRRSILLMTVTGEEKGLLGSAHYTKNPIFPLAQTIADLNIDMIGRIDDKHKDENYIYLIGSDRLSTQLHKISEEVNKKYTRLKFDYKYNAQDDPNQFYYRSDHYNFAKNNIPVIFYFSGVHKDYHRPTDDIEKILFNKVEKTARLIFLTAWQLANQEERIVVDVKP